MNIYYKEVRVKHFVFLCMSLAPGQAWISSFDMDQTMSARQLLHPCVGLFSVDVLFYRVGLFAFFSLPRALQKCLSPIIALSGLVIKTDSLIHVVET